MTLFRSRFAILSLLITGAVSLNLRRGSNNECGMQHPLRIMPKTATFMQNPGAGIEAFKPFQVVLKSGFMRIDCVKDYMYYHGDKFGAGKHNYKLDSVAQVSIVHYEDWVAKEDREEMTPKVCFNFCKSVPNMGNFGLINSKKCYCTPYFKPMPGDSSQCDAQCEGDSSNFCGGKSKSTIFSMHACRAKVTPAYKAAAMKAKLLRDIAKKESIQNKFAKSEAMEAVAAAAAKKKAAAKAVAAAMKAKDDAKKKALAEAALAKAKAAAEVKALAVARAKKEAIQKEAAKKAAKKAAEAAKKAKAAAEAASKFTPKQAALATWSHIKVPSGDREFPGCGAGAGSGTMCFLRSQKSGRQMMTWRANNHAPVIWFRVSQSGKFASSIEGNTAYPTWKHKYTQWKDDANDGRVITNLWGKQDIGQFYGKTGCAAYGPCQMKMELHRVDELRFQIKIVGKDLCMTRTKQACDPNGDINWCGAYSKWLSCCSGATFTPGSDYIAPDWDIKNAKLPKACR